MELDLERQPHGRTTMDVVGSCELNTGQDQSLVYHVAGELTIDNLDLRFLVTGTLRAEGPAECDRCLEPFQLEFDVPIEITVLRDVETSEGDGDSWVIQQKTGVVDLSSPINEATVLALPTKQVCREECRGLCPQCGSNLNQSSCNCAENDVDPRWAGLPD